MSPEPPAPQVRVVLVALRWEGNQWQTLLLPGVDEAEFSHLSGILREGEPTIHVLSEQRLTLQNPPLYAGTFGTWRGPGRQVFHCVFAAAATSAREPSVGVWMNAKPNQVTELTRAMTTLAIGVIANPDSAGFWREDATHGTPCALIELGRPTDGAGS
ncbi:MAG TPA: hypothetical protein VMT30_03040 [Candidatus Saccharimonadia bacterium]|nr:hypothetical protein [Candidatus Saccharimonadia bacterium]